MRQRFVDEAEAEEELMEHLPDVPAPAARDSSYVLVVDDESEVRAFLTQCLEGAGFAVRQAGSAAEALEKMMEKPASVVVCDVSMPGHDGIWLASRLRTHWRRTPVVMAGAIDDFQTVQEGRKPGAADYVTKPIVPEQLLQMIRRVVTTTENALEGEPAAKEELQTQGDRKFDAEYTLESPVRCPACGERIESMKAVRLIRTHVNFTSTLPRRGRVVACPICLAAIPAELTNF